VLQDIQIVLKVEDLLLPAVASLVLGHRAPSGWPFVPQFDHDRQNLRLDSGSGWQGNRVPIRPDPDRSQIAHDGEGDFAEVEAFSFNLA
jgi:hypothetical protein